MVGKAFKVKKVTGHAGDIHEMDYDAVGRLVSDKITIDGQSYTTTTQYDAMDRISSRIFPSGSRYSTNMTAILMSSASTLALPPT
ncbi:MAG: RHS repeat protein [Saprospiraceae bacterium]|nr:RHS repeat protein [Saprospiraceae bacterium]